MGTFLTKEESKLLMIGKAKQACNPVQGRWTVLLSTVVCCWVAEPVVAQSEPLVDPQTGIYETIGLEEIERGMRGYGVSVFSGTEMRRFEVEVVGKLENLNPGVSFIMANLSGQNLEQSGVVAGMSGSPVYLDGRLAGAVAFSWNFSQGALAGITPIAKMRELGELPVAMPASAHVRSTLSSVAHGFVAASIEEKLLAVIQGDFSALLRRGASPADLRSWMAATSGVLGQGYFGQPGGEGTASAMQLLTVGFDSAHRSLLGAGLPAGWQQTSGASAGRADNTTALPALQGGSPVAALLVSGDLMMAVNGTVTERRGDEILAFGHAYLGMGPMSLPMAKAEVVAVVSSRMSSFKISNVGEVVGAFDEDRLVGMRGRVGSVAATTPLSVVVRHPEEGERRFEMQLADLEAMRPMLVAGSVLQCIESATRMAGKGGFDLRATFNLSSYHDLTITQSFDGGNAAIDAAIYLLQVAAFIELNPLVDAEVERITVEVDHFNAIRTEELVDVFADRRAVHAGAQVDLRLRLRDHRGALHSENLSVILSSDLKPGSYYLFVGDGVSVDAARTRIEPSRNRSFGEGLERLGELRSAKQLVVMGVALGRGVVSASGSLPALPGSLREIWQSSNAGQVKGVGLQVVSEEVVERERPLSGVARVDLKILPKRRG